MSGEGSLQEIVCCMGQPVAGNPTQFMMERAFAASGLDWRFLTLEVFPASLGDAVRGMRAMGFRGALFTAPHAATVAQYLDARSDSAELMGAVNCAYRVDDQLIGENTGGKGFVQALREVMDPVGKRVVLLGAGAAARAVSVELALSGSSDFTVVNRSPERGQELVQLLEDKLKVPARFATWQGDYCVAEETDLLINATGIGAGGLEGPVPLDLRSLRPHMVVAEVIVNPPETRLLRDAARCGCPTLRGLGMLVQQGAISFKIWTGVDPDIGVMREALEEYLEL